MKEKKIIFYVGVAETGKSMCRNALSNNYPAAQYKSFSLISPGKTPT
jgi:hypothetical protein